MKFGNSPKASPRRQVKKTFKLKNSKETGSESTAKASKGSQRQFDDIVNSCLDEPSYIDPLWTTLQELKDKTNKNGGLSTCSYGKLVG